MSYRFEILNDGKGHQVTSFRGVSKNLNNFELANYTKKGQRVLINYPECPLMKVIYSII